VRLLRFFLPLLLLVPLVACEPTNSDGCPAGRRYLSSQSWWQEGADRTIFPQHLHNGVGGHLHIETCFPVNQRVDGTIDFDVHLMSHQGFTGHGDALDIGLAPGGESVARVPAPDLRCGAKPAKCEKDVHIRLDTARLPSGLQSLRFRYLPAKHPNGERQFASTEWPVWVRTAPQQPGEVGGKGWYSGIEYANARIRGGVPSSVSGNWCFDFYTKGNVRHALVHVDAAFGDDNEGTVVFHRLGEYRGPACIDTNRFSNGRHKISLRADAPRGDGGVNTGILEFLVQFAN
jgi:hypothetical protein